jgi:D-glycero-alpha-D-manno-heptose 1-phosphate guanylyltransferase
VKAIILAGGMGTRLRAAVPDIPKPMAPVGGKPFLEYLLKQLQRWAIPDVLLSVGYRKDSIQGHFGAGERFGMRIAYSEEEQPLGTGGALKKAILADGDPCYLVLNGDSYFDVPLPELIALHGGKGGMATLGLAMVRDKGRYGSVEVGADGRVVAFQKKGGQGPGWINGGVFLVNQGIAGLIPQGKVSLEEEILPVLQREGLLYGGPFAGFFVDMGVPEDYYWIDSHPGNLL